jgi:hypothetical protein
MCCAGWGIGTFIIAGSGFGSLFSTALISGAIKLRPGAARHEALKEIGRLRIRLDAVATKLKEIRPPKLA